MIQLNAVGRDALRPAGGVHALTDVTGYGLAGHASEMAEGSRLTVELEVERFPVIEGVRAPGRRALLHPREQVEPRVPRGPAPGRARR